MASAVLGTVSGLGRRVFHFSVTLFLLFAFHQCLHCFSILKMSNEVHAKVRTVLQLRIQLESANFEETIKFEGKFPLSETQPTVPQHMASCPVAGRELRVWSVLAIGSHCASVRCCDVGAVKTNHHFCRKLQDSFPTSLGPQQSLQLTHSLLLCGFWIKDAGCNTFC